MPMRQRLPCEVDAMARKIPLHAGRADGSDLGNFLKPIQWSHAQRYAQGRRLDTTKMQIRPMLCFKAYAASLQHTMRERQGALKMANEPSLFALYSRNPTFAMRLYASMAG